MVSPYFCVPTETLQPSSESAIPAFQPAFPAPAKPLRSRSRSPRERRNRDNDREHRDSARYDIQFVLYNQYFYPIARVHSFFCESTSITYELYMNRYLSQKN